jgi:hypothetical protein
MRNEQVGQAVEHIVGPELARHNDGQRLSRELVDYREHAKAPPIFGAILHKVVGPHVIGPFRPSCCKHACGMTGCTSRR